MNDIFAELSWRGLINQTTGDDSFGTWLNEQPRTVYAGFDPTAESLHVGHMLPLMLLRRFQAAGHKPIALVGGATGMIGDPSGKSAERNLLSVEQLRANVDAIKVQMRQFLDFDEAGSGAVLVNNFDWMQSFSYLDFLRDIGKNFPVNVMMAKDSVKGRLEREDSGLSYTEFSYMLLQAYDFVHLFDKHGCTLQIGGSDQWGNITAGIDLGRRMRSAQLFGMTCPLLTKSDGSKMGKTESGAIWLSPDRTSPYAFYQYWINVADEDAGKCLRFLTELDREEIESLDKAREEEPHKRQSQKRLAEALTELVHGSEGVASAQRATEIFFGGEIDNLSDKQLIEIFADVPSQELSRDRLTADDGLNIVDALVESGLCKSKGDARRTISQGGAYVNNRRVEEGERQLATEDLASETVMVLRSGKKKYALLRFV
ncbi:tyrosine--tRNA ligase [Blastopirellula marina]|uniref:Tyrosine--tRNA ligase n=1 Tax=Blastopirellula marina TaxID=124 RepID=A0A2S8GBN4_9BACT|nr:MULTISPECIES: tyrosine--tRNA ligase [Pirellulaceae]PQO41868.1 tyrosine--tRNA ligase [Blastopirellula marina]RCS56420.1 tyrosine--tRNA ligase [Bremerella cremea]